MLPAYPQKFLLEDVTVLAITQNMVALSLPKTRTWSLDVTAMALAKPKNDQNWIRKQKTISLMGSHNEAGWEWNFNWRRTLFDNEVAMAAEFIEESEQLTIQQNGEDSWVWKPGPSGNYTTKTA